MHKKLVELAASYPSKIAWTTLIMGVVNFSDHLPYLCPTIFISLATPLFFKYGQMVFKNQSDFQGITSTKQ